MLLTHYVSSFVSNLGYPTHLEAKNDCPNEPQDKTVVPVYNIMWPHVLQMDPFLP